MKYYLIGVSLFTSLLLAGCGASPEENSKAIKSFAESCQGNVVAEFHISTTGNDMTLKCDKFVAPTNSKEKNEHS